MTAFDFLKWCFSDFVHGLWTVLITSCAVDGIAKILRAARGMED